MPRLISKTLQVESDEFSGEAAKLDRRHNCESSISRLHRYGSSHRGIRLHGFRVIPPVIESGIERSRGSAVNRR